MQAHVICCNDSVEHVVIGTEAQAQTKLEELRAADFERNKWSYQEVRGLSNPSVVLQTREDVYKHRYYWHIHTADLTDVRP